MTPEQLVRCLDFRFVTDALTPEEALAILRRNLPGKAAREKEMLANGYPGYTTSAGWLGYSEEKIRRLAREGVAEGWTHFKQKVGGSIEEDIRRASILREEIGWDRKLMMDANQVWEVDESVVNMRKLAQFDPWWIEEPTNPDDILGHASIRQRIAPIGVATGEHCHNRVMFKQLLQAGSIDFCQVDAARLGGLNEVLIVLLMAAKFKVPVCPHAGGVGLCEYVQNAVRLHLRLGFAGKSRPRIRRPPARALPGPGRHQERPLHAAQAPGLQHRDACCDTHAVRIPQGRRLGLN